MLYRAENWLIAHHVMALIVSYKKYVEVNMILILTKLYPILLSFPILNFLITFLIFLLTNYMYIGINGLFVFSNTVINLFTKTLFFV